MKKGDIFWCLIPDWANKDDRPCVILEVLKDNKVKVLPITSNYSKKDSITAIDNYYDCGRKSLWGYLTKIVKIADIDCCTAPRTVKSCTITNKLREELLKHGFNL